MSHFVVKQHPDNWSPGSGEKDVNSAREVVSMKPWQHAMVKIGDLRVQGRQAWGAKEPKWKNEVIYYDTRQKSLSSILTRIVVHHTDNTDSIKELDNSQRGKGYATIGYHFLITRTTGHIYEGRPLEVMGSHAGVGEKSSPTNDPDWGSVGIALQGDFHGWFSDDVTNTQLNSLKRLLKALRKQYGIKKLFMHREVRRKGDPTVCPGEHMVSHIKKIRKELKFEGPGD